MQRVRAGDIVFSEIRATDGAIGIVPPEFDKAIVSLNFHVVRCNGGAVNAIYLWSVMRTHELRADLMSLGTGTGRYRTDAGQLLSVQVPWLSDSRRKKVANDFRRAWRLQNKVEKLKQDAMAAIEELGVESDDSKSRFAYYKPPQ